MVVFKLIATSGVGYSENDILKWLKMAQASKWLKPQNGSSFKMAQKTKYDLIVLRIAQKTHGAFGLANHSPKK